MHFTKKISKFEHSVLGSNSSLKAINFYSSKTSYFRPRKSTPMSLKLENFEFRTSLSEAQFEPCAKIVVKIEFRNHKNVCILSKKQIFENYSYQLVIFKNDFFSGRPSSSPRPSRGKNQRIKNVYFLMLYSFRFNILSVRALIGKLLPKSSTFHPPSPYGKVKHALILEKFGNIGNIEIYTPQYLYTMLPLFVNFNRVPT